MAMLVLKKVVFTKHIFGHFKVQQKHDDDRSIKNPKADISPIEQKILFQEPKIRHKKLGALSFSELSNEVALLTLPLLLEGFCFHRSFSIFFPINYSQLIRFF